MNYKEMSHNRKLIEIFRYIKNHVVTNKEELAQLFGVSERTITNYFNDLYDIWEVDIQYNEYKRKYVIEHEGTLAALRVAHPLTCDDINLILYTLLKSKEFMPTKMTIIQNSLIGLLTEKEEKAFKTMFDTKADSSINDSPVQTYLSIIKDAIIDKQKISFNYSSASLNSFKEFKVIPYSFACELGKYYLIARIDNEDTILHFRIDRMSQVKKLDEKGEKPEKFNIEQYLKRTWYMYTGEETKIKVKFHKDAYKVVTERSMCDGYIIENDKDKDYFIYEFIANGTNGIFIWLLGFGEKAEILEPVELREKVKQTVANMMKNYE